jgi:hypothetical protein
LAPGSGGLVHPMVFYVKQNFSIDFKLHFNIDVFFHFVLYYNTACKHTYFPAPKTHRPIRRTVIFLLVILEKNNDECVLILVIYWKKTGMLHTKISNQLFTIETQKIVATATKIVFMVVFI